MLAGLYGQTLRPREQGPQIKRRRVGVNGEGDVPPGKRVLDGTENGAHKTECLPVLRRLEVGKDRGPRRRALIWTSGISRRGLAEPYGTNGLRAAGT
jgi:hypothetical protein